MKYFNFVFAFVIAFGICSCGQKSNSAVGGEAPDSAELIKTVYGNFVFAIDANPDVYDHPDRYFSATALNKLASAYEFDCDDNNCYAYYELRTQEQDSKPGTDGESAIISIEKVGEGWFVVKYSDMGWTGMTLLRIVDGKIDDFARVDD